MSVLLYKNDTCSYFLLKVFTTIIFTLHISYFNHINKLILINSKHYYYINETGIDKNYSNIYFMFSLLVWFHCKFYCC